ncbi:TetR/AcrR family transcriptional regulator [Nocardiopsis suaedae]|uniref:TetR/AcrR family transcriptional regulator n=1 Tax=Nocardiopsis suaedae TaxID=3018444 RepID=A0ABT4TFN2_9ACTN|nr:TetR/AcrR family transcriptional regulator [Nocardiopsis suaedae]MDA2803512.1 TetR/AcrR family transcriptional regulator [Nocardiopsis suaedae]
MAGHVDRAERRSRILRAAVRVFARDGVAASRVEDVAAEAGVAKGSVYLYFSGRDALLEAAFEAYAERAREGLRAARTGPGDPVDRLDALIEDALRLAVDDGDLVRTMMEMPASGHRGGPVPPGAAGLYAEYRRTVAGLLAEGRSLGRVRPCDVDRAATVLVGAVEGCLIQWIADPRVPVQDLAGTITGMWWTGLAAEGSR